MNELPPATVAGQAEFLRAGGYTSRYHGWRTLVEDTVGQHTFNLLNLLTLLFPNCSRRVLVATVRHDGNEHITGDMPSTTKRRVPGLKKAMDSYETEVWDAMGLVSWSELLEPSEKRMIKICDYLDGMMYCIQEREMGNRLIDPVFRVFHSYLPDFLWCPEDEESSALYVQPARDLFQHLSGVWVALGGELT